MSKLRLTTVPVNILNMVIDQFTYGMSKSDPESGKSYGLFGWRDTEDAETKYKDALWRHFSAILEGQALDGDDRSHYIALIANAIILADLHFNTPNTTVTFDGASSNARPNRITRISDSL